MLIHLNKIKNIILLFMSLFLYSCNGHEQPIEADDFGFPKVFVAAKGQNVKGEKENELSEWQSSGYKYTGNGKATLMVYNPGSYYYSIWSSWWGNGEYVLTTEMQKPSTPNCCVGTIVNNACVSAYCASPKNKYETIANAPCNFVHGQGLYMLLTNPDNKNVKDPNKYIAVNRKPGLVNFFNIGLWDDSGMYQDNETTGGYNKYIDPKYIGGELYFKILDRYYDDNSGGFRVSLKNGFAPSQTPPIQSVINLVMAKLKSAANSIFQSLVENPIYSSSLKSLLSIYIIIYGMMYIGGVIHMTHREVINMMIKLIIVIQLLTSETSWWVFNNYFFTFFTEGIGEIISIITTNITGASGLAFFDDMWNLLFSYETTAKITALIFSIKAGIVAALLVLIAILIFAFSIAQALMLFLLAYIAIALLISVAPIFITFLLFQRTRSLFDGWISQFSGYFFQPLLVFSALALFGQIIINQLYKILGFKICYLPWIKVNNSVIMTTWQICPYNTANDTLATIPIPGYGFWDVIDKKRFCRPYECTGERYVNLPFLDPASDGSLINAFNSPKTELTIPMLYNSLTLLLICYLMFRFMDILPGLSKTISGGGINMMGTATSSIFNLGRSMRAPFSLAVEFAQSAMKKKSKGENDFAPPTTSRDNIPPGGSGASVTTGESNDTKKNNLIPNSLKKLKPPTSSEDTEEEYVEENDINIPDTTIRHGLTYEVNEAFRDKREDIRNAVESIDDQVKARTEKMMSSHGQLKEPKVTVRSSGANVQTGVFQIEGFGEVNVY
ncbi:MAG: type IV secretion system protein [Pseudomonadota bacterium]